MRLNAKQIGVLAECIEKSLIRHPMPKLTDEEFLLSLNATEYMEDWEKELKDLIDAISDLPAYDELDNQVTEMLVDYIATTICPPKEMIDGEFEYTEHLEDEK